MIKSSADNVRQVPNADTCKCIMMRRNMLQEGICGMLTDLLFISKYLQEEAEDV